MNSIPLEKMMDFLPVSLGIPMFKNLVLQIDTGKKPIELPVHIECIADHKTGLKMGFKGRPVKQLTVLANDDVDVVRTPEDIECVVDRSQVESLFLNPEKERGKPQYVPVNKDTLKSVFPACRFLKVLCSVDQDALKPYMFDGAHYRLSLHGTLKKRVKVVETADKRMYNILYHGMSSHKACLIARFVSFGREKFGAIYPTEDFGFVMSNLIHSNYFREKGIGHILKSGAELDALVNGSLSKEKLKELGADGKPMYDIVFSKIHERHKKGAIDPAMIRDRYEELLKQLISKSKEGDVDPVLDLDDVIKEKDELEEILDI